MKYHKINGVFKRYEKSDGEHKKGDFIVGKWADPNFKALADVEWEWKEKVDGMNVRIIVNPDTWEVDFKGKSDNAEIPKPLQDWYNNWEYENIDTLLDMFEKAESVVLYGEGVGEKIQKGKHGFDDYEVILFDAIVNGVWLKHESVEQIAKKLNMRCVPVVKRMSLSDAVDAIRLESEAGDEMISAFGDFKAEGIVGTPAGGLLDRMGNRIITKIKYKDFK